MAFVDSDDVCRMEGFEALFACLEAEPQLDFCYGKVVPVNASMEPIGLAVGEPYADDSREAGGYHWHTMGALYRKEFVEKVGPWNERLSGSQDWEFQARVKLEGGRGRFVDTVVGSWRQHEGERVGASRFRPDYVESVMLACESILEHARRLKKCDSRLEERLAKKMVLHALECGANKRIDDRNAYLGRVRSRLKDRVWMGALLGLYRNAPGWLDCLLWTKLRGVH